MGCRVLFDEEHGRAALYDSVTEVAFGELFKGCEKDCCDARTIADAFLGWLHEDLAIDARNLDPVVLERYRQEFAKDGLCLSADPQEVTS